MMEKSALPLNMVRESWPRFIALFSMSCGNMGQGDNVRRSLLQNFSQVDIRG